MESLPNVLLLVLMFVLRLGVPLLITVAIAYGLHRLDARWQAEAEKTAEPEPTVSTPAQPNAAPAKGR